jgi:hypothetical protein
MDETIEREIQRLKEELAKRKQELDDIKKLAHKDIDRQFQTNVWDLSEREMAAFIEGHLLSIKDQIDIHPDAKTLTSHRGILGWPILGLKRFFMKRIRFYTDLFADKQTKFNTLSSGLLQAALLRSQWNQERIRDLEERLGQCEDKLVVLIHKVQDIQAPSDLHKDK